MGTEFLVLGPIEVRQDGDPLALGGAQQRRLLAVLLTASGQVLSLDRLEETVWPHGDAPDGARRTLFTYVSRLRAALGDGHVVTRDAGYLLEPGSAVVDSVVFEGLVDSARSAAPTLRVALLDQALALWRGPALGEFAGEWWARPVAARLEELRLVAHEDRIDALLELGEADRAVSEAEGLATAYPLRERPIAQLMRALSATGRQAEALRAFQEFRQSLADQTGLEPSPALGELERSIAAGVATHAPTAVRVARGYVLGDLLGQGSFGTVFRAAQPGVGREVAVKVIRSDLANNPSFVQRFEAEAQLVARLEHPHIVPLYDFWREPGGAYLVFRLMRGGSAEQSLVTDGPWSLDRVSRLVEQIGGALSVAHAAGVVHRDIKPANVLFDTAGNAHLADFGIAATDDSADAGSLYSAGSPLYASPEQFQRVGVSARSDLYSFGAMVWELLTGMPPFEGDSASTIARTKLERPVPSLLQLRPDLAPTIDAVLQKVTAVNPADRFASASELVVAWRAAVEERHSATTDDVIADGASVRRQAAQTMTDLATAGANPYKGLRPFAEADARDYFGRTELIDDLARAVTSSRVTMVVGSSGSGKSSLLHAGLLPRLRGSGARLVTMVPTDRPCAQLQTALLSVAVEPLAPKLEHAVEFVADESPNELVIVVDQFEEVWTLMSDVDERDRFVSLLRRLAVDDSINVRLVFAIRADFFDRPLSEPELGSIVAKNAFSIAPMTAAELSEAVRAPANAAGVTFEPGLDAEIVADVVNQSASLPLLQFALAELYEHRRGAVIPTIAYREVGGVAGAVAARAEALYTRLDEAGQSETRRLFSRLVTPGAGAEDTRRRARRSELPESANAIADQFVTHRLLVVDRDPATREPTIDIAHEALLNRWPRLRGWLDEDREQLQLTQHLSRAADEWFLAGRRESDLYRGPRLSMVGEINDTGTVILAPIEDEFLSASRAARDADEQQERLRIAQQAKQNRRLRRSLVAAGVLLVVALIAGSVALTQRNRADDQRALAATQRDAAESAAADAGAARDDADIQRMVAQSRADATLAPDRAMLLAVEAYKRKPSWQTAGAIQSVLTQQPKGLVGLISGGGPYSFAQFGKTLIAARDAKDIGIWNATDLRKVRTINVGGDGQISLSADERFVAVASEGTVKVFAVDTGNLEALLEFEATSIDVAFDPTDPARLAISHTDGSVEIMRWQSNQLEVRLAGHAVVVNQVIFSDDGRTVATAALDGTARIWDARTGAPLTANLRASNGPPPIGSLVPGLDFSRDGSLFATVSQEPIARVWRVTDGALVAEFLIEGGLVASGVRFVGNDELIVGTYATTFRFDIKTKTELPGFTQGGGQGGQFDVNASESTLAISSALAIELWSLGTGQLGPRVSLPMPPGFAALVDQTDRLSFNEDGTRLLLFDKQAYLYDLTASSPTWRVVEFAGRGVPTRVAFTSDGRDIMTVHVDAQLDPKASSSTFQLWDPSAFTPRGLPVRLPGVANVVRLSPDRRLVTAADINEVFTTSAVRIFDAQTGALLLTLTDLDRITIPTAVTVRLVHDLSFSADSKQLVAANFTGAAAVWEIDSGRVSQLSTGSGEVFLVAFDRVGRQLVTEGIDNRLTFRDAITYAATSAPLGGRVAGNRPRFHPTEALLLTDGTCIDYAPGEDFRGVQLWDTKEQVEIGIGFQLNCAAWTPDGRSFAAKDRTTIQIWDIDPDTWVAAACRFVGRNLTQDEWAKYGPNKPYRETCT